MSMRYVVVETVDGDFEVIDNRVRPLMATCPSLETAEWVAKLLNQAQGVPAPFDHPTSNEFAVLTPVQMVNVLFDKLGRVSTRDRAAIASELWTMGQRQKWTPSRQAVLMALSAYCEALNAVQK